MGLNSPVYIYVQGAPRAAIEAMSWSVNFLNKRESSARISWSSDLDNAWRVAGVMAPPEGELSHSIHVIPSPVLTANLR